MILLNVSLYGETGYRNGRIQKGSFSLVDDPGLSVSEELVDMEGALLLPGFINAHDHLDFNAFPRMGNRKYMNYTQWGRDIHRLNGELIREVQKIPAALRVRWGSYKNLMNGFTTVINHGEKLDIADELVQVIQDYPSIHSLSFEKGWRKKLWNPFARKPLVMHLGEGTDALASREISRVTRNNILRKKIIAVHGVAMDVARAGSFAGLVWCPASNDFLFGKTADISSLKGALPILFGTDSTLTSPWNAWEQFRLAREIVGEAELLAMLTTTPERIFQLKDNGANLVFLRKKRDIFMSDPCDICMVVLGGSIRMIDESLAGKIKLPRRNFSRISLNGSVKLIEGQPGSLATTMKKFYPGIYIPFEIINE